jgi:flagellar motor switch protein FliM
MALARAARDALKLPLEVQSLSLARVGLAEVLETPPERALLAVLEGPREGIGVLVLSPEVMQGMIEMLTLGRVGGAPAARKPTRTDAAMLAPMIDAALSDLETTLAQEADLVWAGGWRYASFLDDVRPLGLMLEDEPYRLLKAQVSVALGARSGMLALALPAEGRGEMPHRGAALPLDERLTSHAFAAALAEQVAAAESTLNAVLARVSLPLSRIMGLQVGDVLAMPSAQLDRVVFEGMDGRALAEGKLGQNRGMRALRLGTAVGGSPAVAAQAPPEPLRQAG